MTILTPTTRNTSSIDDSSPEAKTPVADLVGDEAIPIDPEIEKRVLRKIDLFLMPAMVIGR